MTRTFKTTIRSLRVMRDWVVDSGVTIAAMESTSTYWKSPSYCLEQVMEVWLLNAAHMTAVLDRKTDVRDAGWIAQLPQHGPVVAAVRSAAADSPAADADAVRLQSMGDRTREAVRPEPMLEDASIKLSAARPR